MRVEWMYKCDSANVLLVEGDDDCNIIRKFSKDNNISGFDFCNCRGDNKVLAKLSDILKSSRDIQPKIIGIILDADNNINTRYQEIRNEIKNYKLPTDHPHTGSITTSQNLPKLGIWIMPNNKDNGALEEFYLDLLDKDMSDIENCINQAKTKGLTSFKPQHHKKAVMHTYFAWQDKPGAPLHSAINKITLDNNQETAANFKKWLMNLYG